jgi:hypothetical protein
LGGYYGKGGDLLYRWGNPQVYDQGTPNDQRLFLQHNTHWIPETLVDAGKILVFNNQAGTPLGQNYSTVNTIDPPVDADGFYTYTGGAYGPVDPDWTYQAPNPTDFFSPFISGVQRLPNGNTLICEGNSGRFFEIDANENIVWEYMNPVNDQGPITQNTIPVDNNVFRCTRYAANYPGFDGHTLVPQGYLEIGSTFNCSPVTSIENTESLNFDVSIYPNPANAQCTIRLKGNVSKSEFRRIQISNMNSAVVYHSGTFQDVIDLTDLPKGVYSIQIDLEKQRLTKKLVVQ